MVVCVFFSRLMYIYVVLLFFFPYGVRFMFDLHINITGLCVSRCDLCVYAYHLTQEGISIKINAELCFFVCCVSWRCAAVDSLSSHIARRDGVRF